MTVRAKICGIRSDADLQVAVESGADALGFICGITHISEDVLDPSEAARLISAVPPFISTVLVTHMVDSGVILDLAGTTAADTIQIHGAASPDTTAEVWRNRATRRVVKAVHVIDESAISEALRQAPFCDAILLDSRTPERLGGTGRTHDWSISRQVVEVLRRIGKPTIVAGGLSRHNVGDVINAVAPYGVDVNSGVEDQHGDKTLEDCQSFVSIAHGAPSAAQLQSNTY
jgi:phosphoribosylanthranilate isomerase